MKKIFLMVSFSFISSFVVPENLRQVSGV